jgi:predicted PurR-regulated permease PerM
MDKKESHQNVIKMTDIEFSIMTLCIVAAILAINIVIMLVVLSYIASIRRRIKNIYENVRRIKNISITTLEQNYERAESAAPTAS